MAARFWVGGTGNWDASDTTHWAASSGGVNGASVPTSSDAVTLDGSSGGGVITLTATANCAGLTDGAFGGTLNTNGQTLNITGNYFSSGASARTLTLGASTINISGNWQFTSVAAMTFNANTSTINLTGSSSFMLGGGKTYNNIAFTNSSGAGIINVNTCANLTVTGAASTFAQFLVSTTQQGSLIVSGTLTINGNSTINRILLCSSGTGGSPTPGTAQTISAAVVTLTNIDIQDVIGTGAGSWNLAAITGLSGNCGGNTGITFTTAVDQHWLTAAGGSWSTVGNWTSRIPLPQDNVFMDLAFGTSSTVTVDMARLGKNINWSGATWTTALTWDVNTFYFLYGALVTLDTLTIVGALPTSDSRAGNGLLTTNDVTVTDSSNNNITYNGFGLTHRNLWFNRGASTGNITIKSSNTFTDFKDTGTAAHSILFTAGITTTVTTFTVSGSSGNAITLNSTTTATHALVGSSTVSCDWLNIQHSVASGSSWYAGLNSVNNQGVATAGSGWVFTAPPPQSSVNGFFQFM